MTDTNTPASELLPCPFCGGEAMFIERWKGLWNVGCRECDTWMDPDDRSQEACREEWNARASQPTPNADAVEVLRRHHEWHLAQSEDEHGINLAEAYSDSKLCDDTVAALSKQPDNEHRALAAQPRDDVRDAFKAGWRTNAVGEDAQPASYLDGCEQADWEEYQRVGIDAYCTALSQTDEQPDNELADAADVHMVREAPLTAQERLKCEEVIANLAALCNPPDNEQADAADSEPSGLASPLDQLLRYHETGGHEGDGSDETLSSARQELTDLRTDRKTILGEAARKVRQMISPGTVNRSRCIEAIRALADKGDA